jgi:hypothetical protein
VSSIAGVTTEFFVPDIANHVPTMRIKWDAQRISAAPRDIAQGLRAGNPSIVLGRSEGGLEMNSFMLKPGEDQIIAERLSAALRMHSA